MSTFRLKVTAGIAIVGGFLLLIGGGAGMAPLLMEIQDFVEEHITQDPNVILLLKILIFFAALGGLSVIIGGILIYLDFTFVARILIVLGTGIGLFGLLIGLGIAYYYGESDTYVNNILSTIAGIGIVLSIIAYYMSK